MDEGFWDCSVCTYKNKSEAFKCEVCDTRKGTSTRKPRVTASIVAQQIVSTFPPLQPQLSAKVQKPGRKRKCTTSNSKLSNIDHSSGEELEITVNGVTVFITDYKIVPKVEDDILKESEPKRSIPYDTASGPSAAI